LQIVSLAKTALMLIQIIIPILLIIWGTIDLGKAVVASNEDNIKKAQSMLIKRIIAAVIVFLLVTLTTFVTGLVGGTDWKDCWQAAITLAH
jgi:large-conductance mechanosensitive channel